MFQRSNSALPAKGLKDVFSLEMPERRHTLYRGQLPAAYRLSGLRDIIMFSILCLMCSDVFQYSAGGNDRMSVKILQSVR